MRIGQDSTDLTNTLSSLRSFAATVPAKTPGGVDAWKIYPSGESKRPEFEKHTY